MTTDDIMALANKYAASNGKALLDCGSDWEKRNDK